MRRGREREEEGLKDIQKQFAYWRRHRAKRGPTPLFLLARVEALLTRYSLAYLAKTLHFNPTDIKRRIAESPKKTVPSGLPVTMGKKESSLSFVEMSMKPALVELGGWPGRLGRVEFETPQGYKARFSTPQDPTDQIESLLTTLFRPNR